MNTFKDIIAWQKAHDFVLCVYEVTKSFPEYERYGLWSQFTRAAVSIPANIAEGSKRISKTEKLRFFNIAQGSLEECRYYIILSKELNYVSDESAKLLESKIEKTSYMLNAYAEAIVNDKGIKD